MQLFHKQAFQLITILSVLLLPVRGFGQTDAQGIPLVKHFSPADYNGGIQNWDVQQDSRGLIYVANNFGMLTYDGVEWRLDRIQQSTRMRSLMVASDGRIYVGCPGDFGYLSADKLGRWQYTSLSDQLPEEAKSFDEVWNIYQIDDYVYFCTFQYIFKYHPEKGFTAIKTTETLSFTFLIGSKLLTITHKGLSVVDDDKIRLVPNGELLKGFQITGIIPLGRQQLLMLSHNRGIWVFDNNTLRPWREGKKDFQDLLINCALRLQNGNIAVGTQNNGLLLFAPDGQFISQITEGKGLQNRTVLTIYQDPLENLWLGLNNGLSYIELNSPFSLIGDELGVPGAGYAAVKANDKIYLGTANGLFARPIQGGGEFQLVKNSEGQVYHLSVIKDQLFMGHHQGAFVIEGMEAKPLGSPLGAWKFMQLRQYTDKLIQGSYTGLHRYGLKNGQWQYEEKIGDFSESSRVFEEGAGRTLWMSHGYKGVYRLELSESLDHITKTSFYGTESGFPSNLLINVFKIQDRLLFAAEKGLYQFDSTQNKFIPNEMLSPYFSPNEHISEMSEDVIGNIYFHSTNGIGVLQKHQLSGYERKNQAFNRVNAYPSDDLENITPIDPNNVLIGAKNGFIHYSPQKDIAIPKKFQVLLREVAGISKNDSIRFYGNTADSTQNAPSIEFGYDENNIRFRYAANFYIGASDMEYSYLLDGFDEEWSGWGNKTEKEYTNLPPKKYTFKVKAKSIYGQESEEMHYEFRVLPPWYRTVYAYGFYGILFIAGIVGLVMVLDRKHHKEKRLMEIQQQRVLNRKESQLKEVTQQSEAAITHLKNEKLEAEIKHKTQALATATMGLLHKNEFLTQLKSQLSGVKKKSSKTTAKDLDKIIKNIDRDIASDDSWGHFEHQFAQVYGDFSTRIKEAYPNLTPQEMKLCAYLRMNMSTKEIASLLSISVRGVEIARYRLRKKLELERTDNLGNFILNF